MKLKTKVLIFYYRNNVTLVLPLVRDTNSIELNETGLLSRASGLVERPLICIPSVLIIPV